jgi:hypothetical protein
MLELNLLLVSLDKKAQLFTQMFMLLQPENVIMLYLYIIRILNALKNLDLLVEKVLLYSSVILKRKPYLLVLPLMLMLY